MNYQEYMTRAILEARECANLVEVRLYGLSPRLAALLEDRGGIPGVQDWEAWCPSETCAHASHDAGEASWLWTVPAAWVDEARHAAPPVWDCEQEAEPVLLLMPTTPDEPPILLVTVDDGRWARRTEQRRLSAEAERVAQQEAP